MQRRLNSSTLLSLRCVPNHSLVIQTWFARTLLLLAHLCEAQLFIGRNCNVIINPDAQALNRPISLFCMLIHVLKQGAQRSMLSEFRIYPATANPARCTKITAEIFNGHHANFFFINDCNDCDVLTCLFAPSLYDLVMFDVLTLSD